MADTRRRRGTRPDPDGDGATPEPTEEKANAKRKILKRERVIVLPPEADDEAVKIALKEAKLPSWLKPTIANAWLVVAENEVGSTKEAIEAHAGVEGTPDAKPGIWKAVPVRGWSGGLVYEKPPEPKVEASKFEDDD